MASPRGIAERYADRVRLSLSGQRYLTEQHERALLLEALDIGLSLDRARELLAATVKRQGAAREVTLDHDMEITIAAVAGAKGWISRTGIRSRDQPLSATFRRRRQHGGGKAPGQGNDASPGLESPRRDHLRHAAVVS